MVKYTDIIVNQKERPEILKSEVLHTMKPAKTKKATGLDNIPTSSKSCEWNRKKTDQFCRYYLDHFNFLNFCSSS